MVMIAAAGGGGSAYGTFGEADKPAARTPCCWRGEAKPETDAAALAMGENKGESV